MSVFGSILSKIFHHAGATPPDQQVASATPAPDPGAVPAAAAPDSPAAPASTAAPASAAPASAAPASAAPASAAPASTVTSTPAAAAPANSPPATVDVVAVLEGLAAKNRQKLDWRHSIVDMMKLLDLDSSLSSRQELAKELHYTGDTNDSAKMNIWLHGEVMKKLAANGGKVPDDLRA